MNQLKSFFYKFEEGVRGRRRRVGKSGGVEKIGTGRKNNGGVCSGI